MTDTVLATRMVGVPCGKYLANCVWEEITEVLSAGWGFWNFFGALSSKMSADGIAPILRSSHTPGTGKDI